MITEDTNFNIPKEQRDKLNEIGSEIAYNISASSLKKARVFELITKAWYLGDAYGSRGKWIIQDDIPMYDTSIITHLPDHANPLGFLSYDDRLYLDHGYQVQYFKFTDLPENNLLRLKKVISPEGVETNYLCTIESYQKGGVLGDSHKFNILTPISMLSLPGLIRKIMESTQPT